MALHLYFHPFSSYCQKALVALYENDVAFEPHRLDGPDSPASHELEALWPMKRFPVLVDGARTVIEATCIIEYVGLRRPGPVQLIPDDPGAALETRWMDRFFDNYVATPQQKVVFDALCPPDSRDPYGVQRARRLNRGPVRRAETGPDTAAPRRPHAQTTAVAAAAAGTR